MNFNRKMAWGWALTLSAALAACGGGGGSGDSAGMGTLRVALTDAPTCGYDAVNVTVERVRVHRSSSAGDGDAGWSDIVLDSPRTIDLVTLQNGVLAELGQTPLEAGRYQQVRLVLASNPSTAVTELGLANSVTPTGGTPVALQTPSAMQSGLKMNVDLEVRPDQLLDIVLDFDVCKSVVRSGNTGRYNLKPVVSVVPRFVSGVRGAVAASWPAGTQVSLQKAGVVVKSSTADATTGAFLLPAAAGTYDLVIAAPARRTSVVTDVVVADGAVTVLNTTANAFAATDSPNVTLAGKVTTATTPVDAGTRALLTLAGGRIIEAAAAPVDADTGLYSHVVAFARPAVAPFVQAPGSLTFAEDATAAAGTYSVQAVSGDLRKTVGPFTVPSGATSTNDITLP